MPCRLCGHGCFYFDPNFYRPIVHRGRRGCSRRCPAGGLPMMLAITFLVSGLSLLIWIVLLVARGG
ncbi:TPA: hypothetical protein ACV4T7_002994, partial [Burkholderia ambifaria]